MLDNKILQVIRFIFLLLIFYTNTNAQITEQDCFQAIPLCGGPDSIDNYHGTGAINDVGSKGADCLTGEINSVWFIFQIDQTTPPNSYVNLRISPNLGLGEDFDFAIFGPNLPCSNLGTPIRCSAAAQGPFTGLSFFEPPPNSEDKTKGNGFLPSLIVQPGEVYYILVNNYNGSDGGFTIDISGSALFNCNPEPPCALLIDIYKDKFSTCEGSGFTEKFYSFFSPAGYSLDWTWTSDPPEAVNFLNDPNIQEPTVVIPDYFSGHITYYIDAQIKPGGCTSHRTLTIDVMDALDVSIEQLPELCDTGVPVKVNVNPPGGVFSTFGPIVNGMIDPMQWGPGVSPLSYTVTNTNGCKSTATIDVNVLEAPTAEIEYQDEFCITDTITQLSAFDLGGKWGGAANKKGEIDPKKLGVGIHNITYTVTNGYCTNTDYIAIEVKPLPVITIKDPGPLCSNEQIHSLTFSPKGGKWVGTPDTAGKFSPADLGAGLYHGIYSYVDMFGCKNKDTVDIKISDPPYALLPNTIQVCNTTANNNISTLDFASLVTGGDKKGIWTDVSASGATGIFPTLDFNNVAPGKYTFKYTTNSAKLPCPEASYDIEVEVVDCKCPSVILTPTTELCSDNGVIDLESLKQNLNAGTWSISSKPGGTKPATIQGGSNFTTNNSDPGNYVVTFTLNTKPPAGCPENNTTTITVLAKPVATLKANSLVCNKLIAGNGPVTLDFTTLITSGDNTGTWLDISGSGASGSFPTLDFTGVAPGNYTFSYTTNSAKAPCTESSYTASVTVQDCECPSVALTPNVAELCNDNATAIDLDAYKITAEAGNWSIKSKPAGTNPANITGKSLNINGKDGGTYVLTFTLATTPPVGCPASSDLTLTINASPSAVVTAGTNICNSPQSGNPTTINFTTLITSGDKTGSWKDVDNSKATGTFPNLDFNGVIPGTYTFTYTTGSASFPCTDKSYSVEVTVDNCDCPSLALTSYTTLCNSANSSINLNTLKITTEAGTWSVKQNAAGPKPASLSGTTFDVSAANAGIYVLSFTLNVNPPLGCKKSADVTIEVFPKPVATVTTTATVCNSPGSGSKPTTIDLTKLVTAGDKSGTWLDVSGSGASGPNNNLDFDGVTPGNYTFTYTTNSATAPCTESSYQVTITVEDCDCPSLATKNPGDLCSTNATVDLTSLKITPEDGTWTITSTPAGSNPAIISGNTFNGINADPGSYTLNFTLNTTPPQGCQNSSTQTFKISQALSAGVAGSPVEFCENGGSQVNLGSQLTGGASGGSWKEISAVPSQGNTTNIASGFFNAQGQKAGVYTIQYTVTSQSPCPVDQEEVQVIINAVPTADAGKDQVITCAQTTATLGGGNTTIGADISYSWTGGTVDNPNSSSAGTNAPGSYTLNVENTKTGCKSSDQVVITGGDDIPSPLNLVLDSISCFGEADGKIQFDKVKGGTAPYEVSINGISYGKAQYFNKLPPGSYQLTIVDASGCTFNQNLVLTEPDEIYVDLGADISIELGDSLTLDPFINIPKNEIDTLLWSPIVHGLCAGCLNPVIYPYFTTPIKIEVIDKHGCRATDEMFISVEVARNVYFPNIFSPNDDALNDRFYPFAGDFVERVEEFKVYDRWGDLIFEQHNLLPNDYDKGWDGTRNGQRLNTMVYVYYAIVKFKDGKKKVFKGDVLLRNQ